MATKGTADLDFGAFPGSTDAFVDVASPGVATTSDVEAWIQVPAAGTADHTSDEYWVENIQVFGACLVDGTVRVYGKCTLGLAQGTYVVKWVWD